MRSLFLVAATVVLSACASRPTPPPERPLFTLETAGLADGASAGAPESGVASADTPSPAKPGEFAAGLAYQTSVRLTRPDGTVLTAPRLVAFAGQRATIQIVSQIAYVMDFDVERKDGAAVVDPIIGILHEGALIDLLAIPVPGTDGEAAVGVRVTSAAARKPLGTREFEIVASGTPVTIQTPRVETLDFTAAQRVRLGEETEWARVPDPAGGADLVVIGRIDAVQVESTPEERAREAEESAAAFLGSDARIAKTPIARETFVTGAVDLRPLVDAAAAGAAQGTLRVTAVRLPAGIDTADSPRAEPLGTWSLRTVRTPGVGVSDLVRVAHLADWASDGPGSMLSPPDPVVATATSGLSASCRADGSFRLQWKTICGWDTFQTTLAQGPPVEIDDPLSATSVREVRATQGRTSHPMFTLPGGGTAAIVVEWQPDAPR